MLLAEYFHKMLKDAMRFGNFDSGPRQTDIESRQ